MDFKLRIEDSARIESIHSLFVEERGFFDLARKREILRLNCQLTNEFVFAPFYSSNSLIIFLIRRCIIDIWIVVPSDCQEFFWESRRSSQGHIPRRGYLWISIPTLSLVTNLLDRIFIGLIRTQFSWVSSKSRLVCYSHQTSNQQKNTPTLSE